MQMRIWKALRDEKVVMALFMLYLLNNYFSGGILVFINVTDNINFLNKIIELAIAILAIACACQGKYTKKEKVILAVGYLLSAVIFLANGEMGVSFMWTWLILAKIVPFDRWIRGSLYCNSIAILTGVAATLFGIHGDMFVDSRSIFGIRYTFGLGQPNFTGNILFLIASSYCWLKKGSLKGWDYLVPLFITVICYVFPNSQGTTVVLVAYIFMTFCFQYLIRNEEVKKKGLHFLFYVSIMFAVLSIVLCMINVAQFPLLSRIDRIMSYRYTDAYRTFKEYGFSLFGQTVDFAELNTYARLNGEKNYYMDCMWIYLPVHYGILFSVIFIYVYFSAMYRFVKKGDTATVIIFFSGALYAMEQQIWPSLFTWVFIVFLAEKIFHVEHNKDLRKDGEQTIRNGDAEKSF